VGQVRLCDLRDREAFAGLRELFELDNPGLKLSLVDVDSETLLRSTHGGMRVFWIYEGEGQVFLPRGYRTQEGDGHPLPSDYRPDPLDPVFADLLERVRLGCASLTPAALLPVRAILSRWQRGVFVGDYAGELWRLDHVVRPWSGDDQVLGSLNELFTACRHQGHSTKQVDSFEPLIAGDQIVACADQQVRVCGQFRCLAMENVHRRSNHVSIARRLRYLADTAGGCNPDFDPFRRLPLTWFYPVAEESLDGLNWVNSHVVNIPKETSPTHFHPPQGVGASGGIPQREMYLVLDPQAYQLNTWGREASLTVFPDLPDLHRYDRHALHPGMFVYIPPGTGHRGLDVLVNVLTIPGFKPHNEYYLDRDIHDQAGGHLPYNENLLNNKNYERLADFFR